MAIPSTSAAIPLEPLSIEDLEALRPQPEPVSTDGNGCCWTWSDVKLEWKKNPRHMRHWMAIVVIMVLAIGLAVWYQVGKHD